MRISDWSSDVCSSDLSSFIALMSRIARFSVVVLIFGRGRHALRSMPRPSGTIGRAPSGCPDILCASVYRIFKGRPPTRRALAGRSSMSDPHFYSLSGPLDSMPSERQMRTANLSSFAELVRQYGADPRSILEQHGIDPRALRDPDFYIDCKSLVDVFEYCSTTFNDSLFGLRLAQDRKRTRLNYSH